jgi:hypothetical protein
MIEQIPSWVRDILILAGFLLGATSPLWLFLQHRQANRKLRVEEGGQHVTEFDKLTTKYRELAENSAAEAKQAKVDAKAALDEVKGAREERQAMQEQIDELGFGLRDLRDLTRELLKQHAIVLTREQQRRFDATKPRPLRQRRPA